MIAITRTEVKKKNEKKKLKKRKEEEERKKTNSGVSYYAGIERKTTTVAQKMPATRCCRIHKKKSQEINGHKKVDKTATKAAAVPKRLPLEDFDDMLHHVGSWGRSVHHYYIINNMI